MFTRFFWTFLHYLGSLKTLSIPAVCGISSHLFRAIDKMNSPTLPVAIALFPCTVSQTYLPSQLSIPTCLSPDGTFDVDKSALFSCTISQAYLSSQLSIATCLSPDGTFDVDKYRQYVTSLLARARGWSAAILSSMVGGGESYARFVEQEVTQSSAVKSHAKKCVLGCKDAKDGPLCVITLQESSWYHAYVCNYLLGEADSFMAKKFRNRFCSPYPSYKDLLNQIKLNDWFKRWCGFKTNATKPPPLNCYFLVCCIIWGVVGLLTILRNKLISR